MLKIKNLERHQENLVKLLQFAEDNTFLDFPPVELVHLFTNASQGASLDRDQLERMTELAQKNLDLPVYTTTQAAAWLGVGIDEVRDAIWRGGPKKLHSFKPGHDRLIPAYALLVYKDAYLNEEPTLNE